MTSDLPCGHWNGATATRCGATPTRHYLPGHRCPRHTPAAVAGHDEPPDLTDQQAARTAVNRTPT